MKKFANEIMKNMAKELNIFQREKKSASFIKQLIKMADYYDKKGMEKIANHIDDLLYVFAKFPGFLNQIDNLQQPKNPKGSPRRAYYEALENGPSDRTREIVLFSPYWTYKYAKNIDKGPRDDTRSAALIGPWWAFQYAKNIDQKFRDDTFNAVKNQVYYSKHLDQTINIEQEYIDNIGIGKP